MRRIVVCRKLSNYRKYHW